ncbi:T9SS C-terminal target domain-containing protein [Mariniflexile litorale]|uniref:T9SS C-terminal target domain-containing protein n=1 Tax=Mariniflexile litorale TaxID=3045158 RepID=A0AAU7EAB7_9FLAO|nr:T9SS C-terminal target domain-containing protein [Mariniflexile sp. KMM 9835]MDQ8210556.1 T9SS C-terminal target domain-containing protein [Mariniflexile sp. KMM 9835]
MKLIKHILGCLLLSTAALLNVQCQSNNKTEKQTVKVDFDFSGRKLQEVHDPNYESWVIEEQTEVEKTFNNVKVKLKGAFSSNWFKLGVNAPHYNRLGADGLVTSDSLEMIISGLKAGKHSLLTFHNTFDKMEAKVFPDIKIYVNDKLTETVQPTNRKFSKIEAATAYITFKAETDKDVVIRFVMDLDAEHQRSTFYIWQMVINGFEIDTPDIKKQAHTPFPESKDEHVVFNGDSKLKWQSPKGTVSHKLYFGTNEQAIKNADKKASEFKGELTENEFAINDLYSMTTYYWRVDEVNKKGEITQGNVWSFKPAQLAFPEAEGYGRFAIGGRGGKVVEVTNLNDDGPGSLRDAVNQEIGPRTIVFNVSGNIELKSRLVINQPYITVAGQTAPGEGVTITRAPVGLTGNEGIVRFLKVRIGSGTTYDGMGLTGANHSIIDHCSISWTIDESFSSRGAHNITLQRTLISEALNLAGHDKYGSGAMHGYAATIGGDIGSFHHNLLSHNYGRNWSLGGGLNGDGYYSGKLDLRNNVVYNWGKRTTDGGANEVNFVNNYYKPGASTKFFYALKVQHEGVGKGKQQYFFDGNVMPGYFDESSQEKGKTIQISEGAIVDFETFVEKPFFESYVTTQSASAAYKNVLSDVGANQPFFDKHDTRILDETLKGTYTYKGSKSGFPGMIDTEKDAGGFPEYASETRPEHWDTDHDGLPNWWEQVHGLNENSAKGDFSESNSDNDKDGFTQLEDYLNWMAQPHYFINLGEHIELDLIDYFMGYELNPEYSVSIVENGKVALNKEKLQFKTDKKGLASFVIKVKDAEGDSMSRTINVYVK